MTLGAPSKALGMANEGSAVAQVRYCVDLQGADAAPKAVLRWNLNEVEDIFKRIAAEFCADSRFGQESQGVAIGGKLIFLWSSHDYEARGLVNLDRN